MILLKRLNGKEFVLNADLIKFIEATPDTIITLSTGEKFMVKDTVHEVIDAVTQYRQKVFRDLPGQPRPLEEHA